MKKLSKDQIERLANKYGAFPEHREELASKLAAMASGEAEELFATAELLPGRHFDVRVPESEGEISAAEERIIVKTIGARPVARIRDNQATTEFLGPANESWGKAIENSKSQLNAVIPAIGRIELINSDVPWVGTGWLVAPGIIVTNRHVARAFAKADPKTSRFVFLPGLLPGQMSARIDFLEEEGRDAQAEHPISSVIWIAPQGEADVAFLRVAPGPGRKLPESIPLCDPADPQELIAAIGYPARDPSIPDQALVKKIFGDDVYEKKRLAPGKIIDIQGTTLRHDCSTLGGNSGSALISLASGKAVGLHRAGLLDDSANLGVTATHVRRLLDVALRNEGGAPERPIPPPSDSATSVALTETPGSYRVKLHIPVEITIKVGTPDVPSEGGRPPADVQPTATSFETALEHVKARFGSNPNVLDIRPGYRFKNGWITDERVIVMEVRQKLSYGELQRSGNEPLPREMLGVGVDVRTAGLQEQLASLGIDLEAEERPGKPGAYVEPPGFDDPSSEMFLGPVQDRMDAIFHVSPEAGFENLKAFFSRVKQNVTATMYEWEPNHVSDSLAEAISPTHRSLLMVTQKRGVTGGDATESAVDDMERRLGGKFKHVWASIRRLIPSAYHIKVASRDDEEFWLSSGNWKSSNQPEDPGTDALENFNREWHAIIQNQRLANLFQRYIEYDFKQATRFPLEEREAVTFGDIELFVPEEALRPVEERPGKRSYEAELVLHNEELDIQPLLTPDRDGQGNRIFLKFATEMIQRASQTIYIQNQSFALTDENNEEFDHFFEVVKDKQRSIPDVRIIFRDGREFGGAKSAESQAKLIERLKDSGFNVSPDAMRVQYKCHTKGIIVDSKEVMLGSQNLTNGGSLFNRDASLLVRSPKVAQFFEKVFLYDWDNLAGNDISERVGGIRRAGPHEETPPGFRRVKLSDLLGDD